jgi:hypothetical protein
VAGPLLLHFDPSLHLSVEETGCFCMLRDVLCQAYFHLPLLDLSQPPSATFQISRPYLTFPTPFSCFLTSSSSFAEWVKTNEPKTLTYSVMTRPSSKSATNPKEKKSNQVLMFERYADLEGFGVHGNSKEFKGMLCVLTFSSPSPLSFSPRPVHFALRS